MGHSQHRQPGPKRNGPSGHGGHGPTPACPWLTVVEDSLVLAVIALAPLAMGGRTDLGRLVYVAGVCLLGLVWRVRQSVHNDRIWRSTGVEWLLIAGGAVLVLQLIPLPESVLQVLAPQQSNWLPLWSPQSDATNIPPALASLRWNQISLAPDHTRIALIVYAAHACFFLILCQRLQTVSDIEKLLRQLAVATVTMAIIGLVQYLSGTDRYLGTFMHPSRKASDACSGPFSNPNHFAHFLALGVGSVIIWLQQSVPVRAHYGPTGNKRLHRGTSDRSQVISLLLAGGLTMIMLAAFLARSRGGMLAIGVAIALAIGQLAARRMIQRKVALLGAACLALFALGLVIHGRDQVQQELDTLTAGSMDEIDAGAGRRNIWMANLHAAIQTPIVGTGVGSHPFVYPKFFDSPSRVEYTHAESCYVQLFTETGCLGVGLVLMGIISLACWLRKGLQHEDSRCLACCIAVVSGLVTSCLHAAIDFPWYLASCMSLTVVLAAMAWSLATLHAEDPVCQAAGKSGDRPRNSSPVAWALLTGLAAVLAAPAIYFLTIHALAECHWNQYLIGSLDQDIQRERRALLVSRSSAEQQKWQSRLARRDQKILSSLKKVLRWTPGDARANLRMAALILRIVEDRQLKSDNAMALSQIRDAAIQSQFPTTEAQRTWLQTVLGKDLALLDKALWHARRALLSCPLEAQGYLQWKELAFVRETRPDLANLLLAQAARVRPHDASVLFTIGRELVLQGKMQEALPYWRKAFHRDEEAATEIIRVVAPQLDGPVFVQMFAPAERELTTLMYYYYKIGQPHNMRSVLPLLIQQIEQRVASETGTPAARSRLRLVEHHTSLGDSPGALRQARLAVESAPNLYDPHIVLASQLVTAGHYPEAMKELSWCNHRRPRDPRIQELHDMIKQLHQTGRMARRTVPGPPENADPIGQPTTGAGGPEVRDAIPQPH